MKLNPEELEANGYVIMESIGHKELIPFIRKYIKKWTVSSIIYYIANLIAIALIILVFWKNYGKVNFTFDKGISYFSLGLAIAFALIPLHEYIHALAYKSQGAKNTSYDANLKKFYFYALANKFVATRKEFQIVALSPFVSISSTLIILLFFTSTPWNFTILGILLTHTAFCSGDFGLLSYFDYHKDMDMVTYDDKENKISYFYGKKKRSVQ